MGSLKGCNIRKCLNPLAYVNVIVFVIALVVLGSAGPTHAQQTLLSPACLSLGGKWRSGTLPLVEKIVADWRTQLSSCPTVTEASRRSCGGITFRFYMKALFIWQCHASFVSRSRNGSLKNRKLARGEGCAIEKTLEIMADHIRGSGLMGSGAKWTSLHIDLGEKWKITNLCAREPGKNSPENIAERIEKFLKTAEKLIEAAKVKGTTRKRWDDLADALYIGSKQARLVDGKQEHADALLEASKLARNEAIKLQPDVWSADWLKAIDLVHKALHLQAAGSHFKEASESAEKLALMYQPSLRPDYRNPISGAEFELAARAQMDAANSYDNASDYAGRDNNVARERKMLEKAIEAYGETQRIWLQAAGKYQNMIITKDGKPDKAATQVESDKSKLALQKEEEIRQIISRLKERLKYLPN